MRMDDNVTRILASLSDRTAPGPDKRHGVRESLSSPGQMSAARVFRQDGIGQFSCRRTDARPGEIIAASPVNRFD